MSGHYLDTGSGPMPIAAVSGRALQGAVLTAYRVYLDHRPGCVQCRTHALICDDAAALWDAFRAAADQSP